MVRRIRSSPLENRTSRLRLAIRRKPYWVKLAEGLSLGYRRNASAGSWSMRVADGKGGNWIKLIAPADDYDGTAGALTYWDAQHKARELVRGTAPDDGTKLQTVAEALTAYAADLDLRGGGSGDAARVENHLPASLATKLVAQLNARELKAWRDGLLKKSLAPGSVTRYCKSFKAALNLVAAHDPRVTNREAWRVGLASLPDAGRARNVILTDDQVRKFAAAALEISPAFGLLVEIAAITGARPVQLRRLTVGDVQENRLLMPSSKKGRGKRRIERRPVPIPESLAARLRPIGNGKPPEAPLLVKDDGTVWERWEHGVPVRQAVKAARLDPEVTIYALRHSSVVRMLIKNIPVRVVADLHDTSVAMIEQNYSKFISHHVDDLARSALIDLAVPVKGNIVSLR